MSAASTPRAAVRDTHAAAEASDKRAATSAGTVAPELTALYALLAVAATGRATIQLATHWRDAPLAYGLSAVAAIFYVAAWAALHRAGGSARAARFARSVCAVELAGVCAVGALTLLAPGLFPDDTVWSGFGWGYGFAPAILPAAALWALAQRR